MAMLLRRSARERPCESPEGVEEIVVLNGDFGGFSVSVGRSWGFGCCCSVGLGRCSVGLICGFCCLCVTAELVFDIASLSRSAKLMEVEVGEEVGGENFKTDRLVEGRVEEAAVGGWWGSPSSATGPAVGIILN